jgi:hypothetical protein
MPLVGPPPPVPEWWTYLRPMLAPYLRKLVIAAVKRHGVDVTGWPT